MIKVIEELLKVLSQENRIVVAVSGSLIDTATVATPTFAGSLIGGPVGAVAGQFL